MKMGLVVVLGFLFATVPVWSQNRSSWITTSGEIRIPSARTRARGLRQPPQRSFFDRRRR